MPKYVLPRPISELPDEDAYSYYWFYSAKYKDWYKELDTKENIRNSHKHFSYYHNITPSNDHNVFIFWTPATPNREGYIEESALAIWRIQNDA